jgi:hypothetical protein
MEGQIRRLKALRSGKRSVPIPYWVDVNEKEIG